MKRNQGQCCAGLTVEDESALRRILPKMTGGKSLPMFLWFCWNTIGVPVEGIFYWVTNTGSRQVLLKRRPPREKDPVYGGLLGVMGTMVLPKDVLSAGDPELHTNPFREPLKRILLEAGLTKYGAPPRNVTSRLFPGDRGPVCQQVLLLKVPEDETPAFLGQKRDDGLSSGEWADVEKLPPDVIGEHISLIQLAAEYL